MLLYNSSIIGGEGHLSLVSPSKIIGGIDSPRDLHLW